jgi:hypothetical protein
MADAWWARRWGVVCQMFDRITDVTAAETGGFKLGVVLQDIGCQQRWSHELHLHMISVKAVHCS